VTRPVAPATAAAAAAFIRANTTLGTPPLLPEIRIYLARDAIELWERTEQQAPDQEGGAQPERPPPFWAFPWAGGQALARYVLDQPGRVRGRAVLDFAAGSGLVGIAAARAGAAVVHASETDPLAIAAIKLNAGVNRVRLDAALGDLLDGPPPAVDLLLAGDVFYERALARRLLPWLARARAAGTEVLVGDPGRAYLPRDRCTELAAYEVPVPRALEDADVKHSTVWQLR
jgi:predicted nicotinamide N-methyase